MIEKLKYGLTRFFTCKQMRVACVAIMAAVTIAAGTLLSNSIYTVKIFDGESTYTVRSLNSNIDSAISCVKLKSDKYAIEKTSISGKITTVNIAYTYPVYVTYGDTTTEIEFSGGTVEDALKIANITVDEFDFIQPELNTEITETIYIDYTNIDYVHGTYSEAIPFKTETVYSADTQKGVVKVLQTGADGINRVDYTEKLVNGVSVEKTVVATSVVTEAVNAKKLVGTKEIKPAVMTSADVKSISVLQPSTDIELDANLNPVKYKSKMTVRASAYTYTGNNCSTGVAPKPGYIAVNPKVIPYGTKLYIKSPDGSIIYGYAVAADTGGFIKKYPTGIDLFMSTKSACVNFGVRNMEVYILE